MKLIPDKKICPLCQETKWEYMEGRGVRPCPQCTTKTQGIPTLPRHFADCSLTNYIPQGKSRDTAVISQNMALKACERFIAQFKERDTGLLFFGPCGVGKTHLAIATLKETVIQHNIRGVFYDSRRLLKDIQGTFQPDAETTEERILRPLLTADLLVLDEVGVTSPTTWVTDTLFHVINSRYLDDRLTIFTSNYLDQPINQEESLADRIGVRLRSRLYEMCQTVRIEGEDFRQTMSNRTHLRSVKP